MPQTALGPYFLHVYNVDLGLWVHSQLGMPVSPLSVEAMNLILKQDGILAYIDLRSNSGEHPQEKAKETGKAMKRCWTSCPTSTVMSVLGLCLNTHIAGRPEMVFYGSPLTLALALIIYHKAFGLDSLTRNRFRLGYTILTIEESVAIGCQDGTMITQFEYQEALTYVEEESETDRRDEEVVD